MTPDLCHSKYGGKIVLKFEYVWHQICAISHALILSIGAEPGWSESETIVKKQAWKDK